MEAPKQIDCTKLADYLEVMSKAVFESGMSWRIVEAKWPGFLEAFDGFDPETIANYTPDDIDRLTSDTRIIRNRRKIESTIHNAGAMLRLEHEYGDFRTYLQSKGDFEAISADMRKQFKHFGAFGCYYFLWVVKEPVPDYHEYREKLDKM